MHLLQRRLILLLDIYRPCQLEAVAYRQQLGRKALDPKLAGIGDIDFRAPARIFHLSLGTQIFVQGRGGLLANLFEFLVDLAQASLSVERLFSGRGVRRRHSARGGLTRSRAGLAGGFHRRRCFGLSFGLLFSSHRPGPLWVTQRLTVYGGACRGFKPPGQRSSEDNALLNSFAVTSTSGMTCS